MGYVDPWSVGTFLRLLFSPGKKKQLPIHFVLGWFFSGLKEMVVPQIRNQQRAKPIRSSKVENSGIFSLQKEILTLVLLHLRSAYI